MDMFDWSVVAFVKNAARFHNGWYTRKGGGCLSVFMCNQL